MSENKIKKERSEAEREATLVPLIRVTLRSTLATTGDHLRHLEILRQYKDAVDDIVGELETFFRG